MAREVESVYGLALFEAAEDEGRIEELYKEAEELVKILHNNPDLMKVLAHPDIKTEEKVGLVEKIFKGTTDALFTEVFKLAVEKGHSRYIEKILKVFIDNSMKKLGIGKAEVSSAFLLSDEQKKKVESKLLETTKYRSLDVNYIVDPSLIGGLVIKIGDRVVDSSVKTSLESLRKSLI